MRTCNAFAVAIAFGLGAIAGHAVAFEAKNLNEKTLPAEALRYGLDSYRSGDKVTAVEALNFAARGGNAGAQWKLGSMYAEGDGVERNDYAAFKLFRDIADHAEDDDGRREPFVTSAWAKLGSFFRVGIPNSEVKADARRAREYFWRAAYFGDADAQFNLATMFYNGEGGDRDLIQAAKWANLAADKGIPGGRPLLIEIALELARGHLAADPGAGGLRQALRWARMAADYGSIDGQALLGHILFAGDGIVRQPVDGLMYLTIALARADSSQGWIVSMHQDARSLATDNEWNAAKKRADDWLAKNPAKIAAGS